MPTAYWLTCRSATGFEVEPAPAERPRNSGRPISHHSRLLVVHEGEAPVRGSAAGGGHRAGDADPAAGRRACEAVWLEWTGADEAEVAVLPRESAARARDCELRRKDSENERLHGARWAGALRREVGARDDGRSGGIRHRLDARGPVPSRNALPSRPRTNSRLHHMPRKGGARTRPGRPPRQIARRACT